MWRLHYSVNLPSLGCDFFKLTGTKGPDTGESFKQFPIHAGDYILADRGYATGAGIQYVEKAGGYVTVRVNTGALRFQGGIRPAPSTCWRQWSPCSRLGLWESGEQQPNQGS